MPPPRTPWSVRIATAALVVFAATQTAITIRVASTGQVGWAQVVFAVLLFVLLLAGFVRGSRLAWLWGRFLGFVLAAAVVAFTIATWRGTPAQAKAVLLLGFAAPLVAMAVALGRPAAYAWFHLVCPDCGKRTGRGADLLYRQVRCRSCGKVF